MRSLRKIPGVDYWWKNAARVMPVSCAGWRLKGMSIWPALRAAWFLIKLPPAGPDGIGAVSRETYKSSNRRAKLCFSRFVVSPGRHTRHGINEENRDTTLSTDVILLRVEVNKPEAGSKFLRMAFIHSHTPP